MSVEFKKKKIEIAEEIKNNSKSKIILGRKKKSSTISINSSLNTQDKKELESEKPILNLRSADFTETKMLQIWKDLIFFIKEKGKLNLGITLDVHPPVLLDNYLIELPLSNYAQDEIITEEKYIILEFLRNKLENDKIEIATKIIEGEKSNIPYTNKDKFKKMLEENPNLVKLRIKLGLDPDY